MEILNNDNQKCIDECNKCAQACYECFKACLDEPNVKQEKITTIIDTIGSIVKY